MRNVTYYAENIWTLRTLNVQSSKVAVPRIMFKVKYQKLPGESCDPLGCQENCHFLHN